MATRTSIASGLWSDPTTWDTGVPIDNDLVIVNNNHVVGFDVDQSGFPNGLAALTINNGARLYLVRTPGTYFMKIKTACRILGGNTGIFDCGTPSDVIPKTAKHTVKLELNGYIGSASNGLNMTVFGQEPANKYVKLTAAAGIGTTRLFIDKDLSSDIWDPGDTIRVLNRAKGSAASEEYVISAIGTDYIDLTTGISVAKNSGSWVFLMTRWPLITGPGNYLYRSFPEGKLIIGGGAHFDKTTYLSTSCSATITGGIFEGSWVSCPKVIGNNAVFYAKGILSSASMLNFTNCILMGGTGSAVNTSSFNFIAIGCSFFGMNSGGWISALGAYIKDCLFEGGQFAIYYCPSATVINTTFLSMNYIFRASLGRLDNVLFEDAANPLQTSKVFMNNVRYISCNSDNIEYASLLETDYSESINYNYNGTAGNFKAWTKGGTTVDQASILPPGFTKAYNTTLGSEMYSAFWQKEITVLPGKSVNLDIWLRKSVSTSEMPKCSIFDKTGIDPIFGGVEIYSFAMTNSIGVWENNSYIYTNTGEEDITLIVRIQGKRSDGNLYSALGISSPGGGIPRSRLIGGI